MKIAPPPLPPSRGVWGPSPNPPGKGGGGNYFLSGILLMYLFIYPMLVFAGQSPVKILIQESGIYSIASTELEAAGLSLAGLDPQTLQITNRGSQIPIHIQNKNGGFEVVFYATGISRSSPEYEFTDTDVYWLSVGGQNGLRMKVKDAPPAGGFPPVSFFTTLHLEKDLQYSISSFPEGDKDHWFWDEIPDPVKEPPEQLPVKREYLFTINHLDLIQEVFVKASLQGETDLGHHTRVSVNDCLVDDDQWSRQVQLIHEGQSPGSCLRNGENTLILESLGDFTATVEGNRIDRVFLNWFEIDYWYTYYSRE